MKKSIAFRAAIAAIAVTAATVAHAGKIEKVDMVREGIDMKQIAVKANGSGYTGHATSSHKYMLRLYAKTKKHDGVYWAAVGTHKASPFEVSRGYFFQHTAGTSNGWAVYKKSVVLNVAVANTWWYETPVQACTDNLKKKVKGGMARADVLKREWDVTARAKFVFSVAVDDQSDNRKNKHKITRVDHGSRSVVYPVSVKCRKGL